MKLKEALKKFSFLKKLGLTDPVIERLANHLGRLMIGSKEVYLTPLAKKIQPLEIYVDWMEIYQKNIHRMNPDLLELEDANESKFGPRSFSSAWPERVSSLEASYRCQNENHIPKFKSTKGPGTLSNVSLYEAIQKANLSSSSGLPLLKKKSKVVDETEKNFEELLARRDPGMIYTRTAEKGKTRNTIGYPFADTLLESMFYIPFLLYEQTLYHRAAIVSPELVAQRLTEIIQTARKTDRIIYSVDFKGFDASILYQYIILAFEDIKSCFASDFHEFIDYICVRMYTINLVTPNRVFTGKHGIPSGSGWTNAIDSRIQFGIAMLNEFISALECQIQGDDGVYIMLKEQIAQFVETFKYAGLKLEQSKCKISSDCAVYCQRLYHIDYIDEKGIINGIYPTWRALNRLIYQERFVNFKSLGLQGKDYYGIRSLTILENCKYHPLHEELVRYVLSKEKFSMDVSEDGLNKYLKHIDKNPVLLSQVNSQYGSSSGGVQNFVTYKLIKKILAEEAKEVSSDDQLD